MATVTYHNIDGSAPFVNWHGFRLEDGKAVEVPDDNAMLDRIEQKQNPFFEVSGRGDPAEAKKRGPGRPRKEPQAPRDYRAEGAAAAKANAERVAPNDTKPEDVEAWYAGYDAEKAPKA